MSSAAMRRTGGKVCICTCAGFESRLLALEAWKAATERVRTDRDEADAALRRLLPSSTRQLPFTTGELLRHATVDEHLHAALLAADIDSPASAGTWLRDRAGVQDGVGIVRLPGRGRRWQARHVDTYVSPLNSDF